MIYPLCVPRKRALPLILGVRVGIDARCAARHSWYTPGTKYRLVVVDSSPIDHSASGEGVRT